MSLLIDSFIFYILFSRFLIIFTIIFLNNFSGSLLIYSSFIQTFVLLVCSFICVVFLCHFIFFFLLTNCFWVLLFQGFKFEFFSYFGFCPSKGWSSDLCKLHIAWDLCWVIDYLLVFPLMGKTEWVGNPVCWWLDLYFCFVCCLDEASCTGCSWWLGDAG